MQLLVFSYIQYFNKLLNIIPKRLDKLATRVRWFEFVVYEAMEITLPSIHNELQRSS